LKTNLDDRIRVVNDKEVFTDGEYVLYWMIATRRFNYNASLEYAAKLAEKYDKPLLVIEEISTSHKFANDRITSFVIQGMVENISIFKEHNIRFIPWVETPLSGPMGLLKTLAKRACLVVTDDFPTYYPLSATKAAGRSLDRKVIAVDSNGVFPMSWTSSAFSTAHSFRRFIHANFSRCQETWPQKIPINSDYDYSIDDELYQSIIEECSVKIPPYEWLWRCSEGGSTGKKALSTIDIDHKVQPVRQAKGGRNTAAKKLAIFLKNRLFRYNIDRNNIEKPSVSGLSPWLHFGHISSIEIVGKILESEKWTPENITTSRKGAREGWWGLSAGVESFLDQIITWRELGFNNAYHNSNHNKYESIPEWAKLSLSEHSDDERMFYTFEQIENAETHDEVWNAAQQELLQTGIIHNYLRMLWGKRILEWAQTPEQAVEWMIELNDKYALDGRDPNSYTGIFWVLGRHDRAWGPERAIFGKIRYMSSENTKKKLKLKPYLQQFRSR
tara:strand:+ start:167 stop:1666 length:1500 start_codon:yes stop_codon:yes gene_type:complete